MKFCSHCGERVVETIPESDNRMRFVCESCKMIHYQNPKIVSAVRESVEEANLSLKGLQLYTVTSLPQISQVYMIFRGEMDSGKFFPGDESLETRLFFESEIPWHELAFPVIKKPLEIFFVDRQNGEFKARNMEYSF